MEIILLSAGSNSVDKNLFKGRFNTVVSNELVFNALHVYWLIYGESMA
jgi:hypothetical protein